MFRCIHANSANLFHGRSPLFEICNDLILAQSMPSGAVHPNTRLGHSNYHAATAGLGHSRQFERATDTSAWGLPSDVLLLRSEPTLSATSRHQIAYSITSPALL